MEEDLKRRIIALETGGAVALPEGYVLPARTAHSIARTGRAIVSFGDARVCKTISSTDPDFTLVEVPGKGFKMMRKGKVFLWNVRLEPLIYVGDSKCSFVMDPSEGVADITVNSDDILCIRKAIEDYSPIYNIKECLISGDVGAPLFIVAETAHCNGIEKVVYKATSPIPETTMSELSDHGITGFKLDLLAARRDMFSKLNPDKEQDCFIDSLKDAARVFGKGNVTTTIICGIGESKADIDILMESLCRAGVIPVLRNASSSEALRKTLDSIGSKWRRVLPEEDALISEMRQKVMRRHGLAEE